MEYRCVYTVSFIAGFFSLLTLLLGLLFPSKTGLEVPLSAAFSFIFSLGILMGRNLKNQAKRLDALEQALRQSQKDEIAEKAV